MQTRRAFAYGIAFEASKYWGMSTQVDLENCDKAIIKDRCALENWVKQLLIELDMKAVGKPMIEYCGTEPHLYGYSVLQLIQTSDITAHFCDATGDAYIDIFSCKEYNPAAAGLFCQDYFKAENMIWSCSLRGKGKRL